MKTKMQKQHELEHKRAKERKETTSIRLSCSEKDVVEKKAAAKGMTTSAYIGYAAVHGGDGFSPEIMIRIQNFTNHAVEVLRACAPEEAKRIRKEGNELWDLL